MDSELDGIEQIHNNERLKCSFRAYDQMKKRDILCDELKCLWCRHNYWSIPVQVVSARPRRVCEVWTKSQMARMWKVDWKKGFPGNVNVLLGKVILEAMLVDRTGSEDFGIMEYQGWPQSAGSSGTRETQPNSWHIKQCRDRKVLCLFLLNWEMIYVCYDILQNIFNYRLLLYTQWILGKINFKNVMWEVHLVCF